VFRLISTEGKARRGVLDTPHGTIQTPVFMNVGTQGAIKGGISAEDLETIGTQVELSNTYHLHVRPGDKLIREMGGLHKFMTWNGPMLTDSGGFQIFSLAQLRKITEEGVNFNCHLDGRKIMMRPEDSMRIQSNLGSDIAMAFDECVKIPSPYDYCDKSCERTFRWLVRCKREHERLNGMDETVNPGQLLFGINQGATFPDLRIRHMQQIAELEDAVSGKAAMDEKLKSYIAISGQGTKALAKANAERAMRDREGKLIPNMQAVLKQAVLNLKSISSSLDGGLENYMYDDFGTSPNAELLEAAKEHCRECRDEITGKLNALVQFMREAWPEFEEVQQKLVTAHQAQELQYNTILEQCNADRNAIMERRRLERELDEMRKKEAELTEKRNLLKQNQEDRTALNDKLSEQMSSRFSVRNNIVERINAAVGPGVRVTLNACSNLEPYKSYLVEKLKGNQMKYTEAIDKIAPHLTPTELAGVLGRGPAGRDELLRATGINARQAEIIANVFKSDESRFELEMIDLPDLPTIELLDGEIYKPTKDLSTGQKCNAILPILLLDSDRPLIIDQPEDNLDNAFIHSTVVKSIQAVKRRRQLIFVTHNPNIPVLGEAEQMLVLESNGTEGRLRNSGGIEHCKDDIVNLLEGGKEAFEKRKECYARIEKQQEDGYDGNICF